MEVPELDIQGGLDRLRRWESRAISALKSHHETFQSTGRRDRELEKDIEDFAIAAVREMGDVLLRCREQVELAWKATSVSHPVKRAKEFEEDLLEPHPGLRGVLAARHADAHLGGLVVPKLIVHGATDDRDTIDIWVSPRIPPAMNELLRRKLTREELLLFNASSSLKAELGSSIAQVEAYVGAVSEEVDRIRHEEVD